MPRPLCLTAAHLAQIPPYLGPPQPFELAGEVSTDEDLGHLLDDLLAKGPRDVWIFAYGSLIWNPEFPPAEDRIAHLHGWHRKFCLGPITIFRGCPDRPGLMLALDRGGSCRGVAYKVQPSRVRQDLIALLRREMPLRPAAYAPRWSKVQTDDGPVTALLFPIDRRAAAYARGACEDQVITSLSTAAGDRGTMAEYLLNTVSHLQKRGIHDRYLWRLQSRVAQKIMANAQTPTL